MLGGYCIKTNYIVLFTVSAVTETNGECNNPSALGMESGTIQDNQITASSYWNNNNNYGPSRARLHDTNGWTSGTVSDEWLQVDLLQTFIITGIKVQGSPVDDEWVKKLQVQSGETEASLAFIEDGGSTKVSPLNNVYMITRSLVYTHSLFRYTVTKLHKTILSVYILILLCLMCQSCFVSGKNVM